MRILGIDPGLTHTGWGIIEQRGNMLRYVDCGVISTDTKQDIAGRLSTLHQQLSHIIHLHQPSHSAIEDTFVNSNAVTSLKLGHARGVLLMTLALANLPITEYAPTKVKKSLVGAGRAEKGQMERMVQLLLPQASIPRHDAADALAIAICHAHHQQLQFMGA